MLEGMDARVVQRRLVHERDVPEHKVVSPERQGHRRMGQKAEAVDPVEAQQRLKHRPRQPDHEAERREIADQDVLEHVHEEELGGERVDR